MGYEWAPRCVHVNFGLVKLPSQIDEHGNVKEVSMSTRKGRVVLLDKTLNESRDAIHSKMLEDAKGKLTEIVDPLALSDWIGLSAVVVQDLSAKRIKDYEFHVERVTSFQGFTGPYLQYSHARCCSMRDHNKDVPFQRDVDFALLSEANDIGLIRLIAQWPEVVQETAKSLEPCTIVTFLFELAHAISLAHKELWITKQERPVQLARLLLFESARIVLGNGLRMLGLIPVERM